MRCFPCHTPGDIDPENPKHKIAKKRHREFVQKYGQKMNLFRETPQATMAQLIASSRRKRPNHYPLINVEEPANSLLVLKPTAKVPRKKDDGSFEKPSSFDPVTHMGGLKMHLHDHSYKLILAWLEDYAAATEGSYLTVADLPENGWQATQRILRMKEVPESWEVGSIVQLFVYPETKQGWASEPIAFTQGTITPRRFVNGALMLLDANSAPVSEDEATDPLSPGRYLIRVCLDRDGTIAQSPSALLEKDSLIGETKIDANWKSGFPKAEVFSASQLTQDN